MTASVKQGSDGAWRWEILDEDGETYLRSLDCFADEGNAVQNLECSSYLIRSYLSHL